MTFDFEVRVSAFERITDGATLYEGDIERKEYGKVISGCGLEEISDKTVPPGYFTNLRDFLDAVEKRVNEELNELPEAKKRSYTEDFSLNYRNAFSRLFDHAYLDNTGAYVQRNLTTEELTELITISHDLFKPRFFDK